MEAKMSYEDFLIEKYVMVQKAISQIEKKRYDADQILIIMTSEVCYLKGEEEKIEEFMNTMFLHLNDKSVRNIFKVFATRDYQQHRKMVTMNQSIRNGVLVLGTTSDVSDIMLLICAQFVKEECSLIADNEITLMQGRRKDIEQKLLTLMAYLTDMTIYRIFLKHATSSIHRLLNEKD